MKHKTSWEEMVLLSETAFVRLEQMLNEPVKIFPDVLMPVVFEMKPSLSSHSCEDVNYADEIATQMRNHIRDVLAPKAGYICADDGLTTRRHRGMEYEIRRHRMGSGGTLNATEIRLMAWQNIWPEFAERQERALKRARLTWHDDLDRYQDFSQKSDAA
jgi:hypothetical protein